MYCICHPDLMGLFQTVHVPKLFAPAQAKEREEVRLCSIKSTERK